MDVSPRIPESRAVARAARQRQAVAGEQRQGTHMAAQMAHLSHPCTVFALAGRDYPTCSSSWKQVTRQQPTAQLGPSCPACTRYAPDRLRGVVRLHARTARNTTTLLSCWRYCCLLPQQGVDKIWCTGLIHASQGSSCHPPKRNCPKGAAAATHRVAAPVQPAKRGHCTRETCTAGWWCVRCQQRV